MCLQLQHKLSLRKSKVKDQTPFSILQTAKSLIMECLTQNV